MVITELTGGLGNQLFQYASAKSLSLHHHTQLKLDIGSYLRSSINYELNNFTIEEQFATKEEIDLFLNRNLLKKIADKLKPAHTRRVYREPFFHFDPYFYQAKPDVYLKGLRQSEKYFLPYQDAIKAALQFKVSPSLEVFGNHLSKENSISIHIRRGDYLSEKALKILGLTPLSYYQRAIEHINKQIKNPIYYFFSDDISWVEKNFKIPHAYQFVSNKITQKGIEDLFLMSKCQHNIIANSSFSWWGAWLNNNPNKIVIAPKHWFNEGPKDTQDLYPTDWITL